MTTNGGMAHLFRNDGGNQSRFVRIRLRGSRSNRNGYGTRMQLSAGGRTQTAFAQSGHSYLSQSESVQTFGLGSLTRADKLRLVWPSGTVQELGPLESGQEYLMDESKGIVR